jgi:S1-C subfamily serine protease
MPPTNLEEAIVRLGKMLYEGATGQGRVAVKKVLKRLAGWPSNVSDLAIQKLLDAHLVARNLQGDFLVLVPEGKMAYESDCLVELASGWDYVVKVYRGAVVHVIVVREGSEASGSGFFTSDFPDCVLTAAHVTDGAERIHIETEEGERLAEARAPESTSTVNDLALVRCPKPPDVKPIRLEWNHELVPIPCDVLVLGTPRVPVHLTGFSAVRAQIQSLRTGYLSGRQSFLLSADVNPGFSGGPVILNSGRGAAVVSQHNFGESEMAVIHPYVSATPASLCASFHAS